MREGYVSPRLQELCGYYSNRLSYEEVAGLVERVSGKPLLSDQTIWHIVKTKAEVLSQQIRQSVERTCAQANPPLIRVNPHLDLYDPVQRETLVFDDGIQVKGQRENRHSKAKDPEEKWSKGPSQSKTPAITTDIVMLQKPTGDFEYITAPLDDTGKNALSLATVVRAKVMQFYGSEPHPLNLVAITDGARAIRNRMLAVFGVAVVIILDWYHLCKKLRDFMSMIAVNKTEKSRHLKFLLPQLWQGKTRIVLEYLKTQVAARNQHKCEELIAYLKRHQHEIIDYNRRSKAGKTIGSGRMEKGVDLAVGCRQKKKAMSWRPRGSKALSLLKVAELNGQWQQLWLPAQTA